MSKNRKTIIKAVSCILLVLVMAETLLFCGNLPAKDEIRTDNLPQEFRISIADNYIDFQPANECSAYASAYVMRHLGREITGSELYDGIRRVFGFVSVNNVVRLFQNYGYSAKAYHGDIDTLKRRLISGVPIIVFLRTPDDTHYAVVVGYDDDFVYLVDSISDNSNANGGWYNRKLGTAEFEEIWKTSVYPVANIYIVISRI